MRLLAFLFVCGLAAWPTRAEACSCSDSPDGLPKQLRKARDTAVAIFRARVTALDDDGSRYEARMEVLEVFKGTVSPVFVMPTGLGTGGCVFPFEAGVEYLVYAFAHEGRLQSSLCSRTREVSQGDSELDWLRTGNLPSVPVALQREVVQCDACELDVLMTRFVGPPPGDACSLRLDDDEALQALKEGRPFWTGGFYDHSDRGRTNAVGMSLDLRPFELVQTPFHGTKEACHQRVTLRWCERLEALPPGDRNVPAVRCVNPGPEEVLCDETKSRKASWAPREHLQAATCSWRIPARPRCTLEKEQQPFKGSGPTSPLLVCRPAFNDSDHHCQVVPGNAGP